HYRSYVQLTLNLWKVKNYPEAVHYAQESLNFAPDHPEVLAYSYSLVAQAYEKVNDYPAALHAMNQALHHSHQSDYTYVKARYYALLQDVASAMSELKKTIELNPMYFTISLMDSAFHPYHREREKLLTSLKTALESKLNQAISQMEAVQFHRYTHSKWSEGELEYNGFDNSIIDYRYKHLHPDFKQYRFVYVGGVEGKRIPYSYNRLVGEFHEHYTQLYELYMKKLPVIKQFKSLNTYVDFTTSYKEFTLFQTEFNRLVVGLTALVNRFKEKSATTQQIFKENLDLALEISAAMKKRLKQEKGKKVFNLLGVVGAILLPMKIQHDHMAESCLEKLYQRVKKVTAEARRNVELEGKHTLAIQRFAEEVLIQKPLPNIL
ncbi:tetratricopeptide repeat protein, partial [Paenibacillus barengoltzii]|uniref:tetratricopeptide repeat protein n=1 Tax=Paenibacillus barengoltzii TaxID=343517 RepID=UPI0013E00CCC